MMRIRTVLAALAAVGAGAVLCAAPAAAAAAAGSVTSPGARIHSAMSFGSPVVGLANPGDNIIVDCVARGPVAASGAVNWLHVQDWTTGVNGWASNDVMSWSEDGAMVSGC